VRHRLILDLCGGTGSWSRPYAEAGYEVSVIDPVAGGVDVRLLHHPGRVHGILAAPPCTMFCRMRMCRGVPTAEQFREALSVVDACLRIVAVTRPKWWALENPQGYLSRFLGQPRVKFDPCDFGDPWTKRTWLWGDFALPMFTPTKPAGAWIHRKKGSRGIASSDSENAVTPPGFSRAFFEANQ
jgi:hypothetical protein